MRKFLRIWVLVLCSLFLCLALPRSVNAAIISPPVLDLELAPGQVYNGTFSVFFTREDPGTLYLSMKKLEIYDLSGEQNAIDVDPSENTLANWVQLDRPVITKPANITYLNGDNAVLINYTISVPFDAPPGGHYAAIVVSEVAFNSSNQSNVAVSADVTLQLLLNLQGQQTYNTTVDFFHVKDNQIFFDHLPVEFETLFSNKGNVHVIPRGNIEVKQGGNIVGTIGLNPGQHRVLPSKSRLYENIWSEEGIAELTNETAVAAAKAKLPSTFWEHVMYELNHFRIGYFTAELQGYAGSQPAFKSETYFWVIPWQLILVILVVLAVIITLILSVFKIRKLQANQRRK